MALTSSSKMKSGNNDSFYLNKLSTLREFITGMGMKVTEGTLSQALRESGYSVELALERILCNTTVVARNDYDGATSSTRATSIATPAAKKRTASSSLLAAASSSAMKSSSNLSSTTPKANNDCNDNKRYRPAIVSTPSSSLSRASSSVSNHSNNSHRLLLCKRWTVAISKSIRGRVNHSELLNFSQNWNKPTAISSIPMDPMVRFKSSSGNVEGSLNSYLCSILSPLLRLSCCSSSTSDTTSVTASTSLMSLIHLEGEALMEDRNIIIGSDVPLSLKIYLNDPIQFFDLFNTYNNLEKTDSKLFFYSDSGGNRLNNKNTPRKKKKMKVTYSREELAEAAFCLLQWAENGEELPLFHHHRGSGGGGGGETGSNGVSAEEEGDAAASYSASANSAAKKDRLDGDEDSDDDDDDDSSIDATIPIHSPNSNNDGDGGDGDYEQNSVEETEELNELNQLVATTAASSSDKGGSLLKSIPELSDPIGFNGVELRAYQRQALYWMCRREGYVCEEMDADNDETNDGEMDLLAELAGTFYSSSRNADPSILVYGSKAISCDCGPVVVSGDSVIASSSIPVADYRQTTNPSLRKKYVHHPLWKRRFLATDDLTTAFSFYVNELLGIASCVPPNPPKQCVGGILADSMGLGKTVMILSLILTTKEAEDGCCSEDRMNGTRSTEDIVDVIDITSEDDEPKVRKMPVSQPAGEIPRVTTTLIIVPLSLISQWEEELATKTNLSYLVFYDTVKKSASSAAAFSSVDVVVTTYGTVQSEFKSMSWSGKSDGGSPTPGRSQPLLFFDWKRIILDEAHGIKNPSTIVSRACCLLKAESRWAVTGTPITNSLQDVYGLLKFLRHEPWCEANFWRKAINGAASNELGGGMNSSSEAVENGMEPSSKILAATTAFGRVRRVLAPIILRRTKDTVMEDGTPILTLPHIDFSIVDVRLSDPEREFYNALLERSQSVFEGFLRSGTATKSWFAIFSLLTRLRQACDHVSLTVHQSNASEISSDVAVDEAMMSSSSDRIGEGTVNDKFLEDLLAKFKHSTKEHTKEIAETVSKCIQSHDKLLKTECPICFEEPNVIDSVHTPCAHMFCKNCILDEFREQKNRNHKNPPQISLAGTLTQTCVEGGLCPVCNEYVKVSTLIQIKQTEDGGMTSKFFKQSPDRKQSKLSKVGKDAARETLELALNNGASSSKLDAILKELDEIWKQDTGSKVLIYSQYLGFLDIIGEALKGRGVACYRIDGKMSLNERVSMIRCFNESRRKTNLDSSGGVQRGSVCLGSMKAAGVGLNLVAASTVFIVDPWWNAAVEDQCVNRIHRIGQRANVVRVRKFVVVDSVEEKIVNLQRKKKGMANEILNEKGDGQLMTKPTLEDFKLIFGR